MIKFKFIGDPDHEEVMKDSVEAFGVTFKKGEASEVKDERAIGKLRGNSHFEEVKGKAPAKKEDAKAAPKKAKTKTSKKKG